MTRASGSIGFSTTAANKWAEESGLSSQSFSHITKKPRKIMLRGDGSVLGAGISGASIENSPSRRFKDALIASGNLASDEFMCGCGGFLTSEEYAAFDSRITLGAGWVYVATTTALFGSIQNISTAEPLFFTPTIDTDSAVITITQTTTSTGAMRISYGGVSKDVSRNAGTAGWAKVTFGPEDGITPGAHQVKIIRTSSGGSIAQVESIECFNSKMLGYRILNASGINQKIANLTSSTDAMRSLYYPEQVLSAGDECWLQIGIHDWVSSGTTNITSFTNSVAAWADRCILTGIIPRIFLPIRSSSSVTTTELMASFDQALISVAADKNIKIHSFADRWGSYAEADGMGLMATSVYPNWYGSLDQGQFYSQIALF